MSSVWIVALKELRQIRRDTRTLLILAVVPTFFLFLYGYALNFDIRNVRLAVEDRDASPASRQLIAAFDGSPYFDVIATPTSPGEGNVLMDRGDAAVVLVIPEGFGADVHGRRPADVQVLVDGGNANSATTIVGYTNGVLRQAAATAGPMRAVAVASVEPRVWYNPELRSTVFLVPGLIAFIAMITAVIATAISIVREKERGTMEQIRMAPVSTTAFVLGKTLPYLVLSQIGATGIVLAAMFAFAVPMTGNWIELMVLLAGFLFCALGTGLLISTIADTQEVAFQVAALLGILPTLLLSGFIFPLASMPYVLQAVSTIVPARYFLTALRGIMLKGLGLADVWPALVALALYGVAVIGLSAVRLARR